MPTESVYVTSTNTALVLCCVELLLNTSTRASPTPARELADSTPQVKLPKLSIRPFNGDKTTWTTFWNSFESAIDGRTSLSHTDKFNYFRSLIEKAAAEAISGLTFTADKYK